MRRSRRLALLAGLTAIFAIGLSAPALADICDKIPSIPLVPNPAKGACKVAKAVPEVVTDPAKAATDVVTAPFQAASDAVMQGLTNWVADGAGWLVGQAGKLIDETTTPRIESPWFSRQYGAMAALAAIFALPLLFLSTIQAVTRRDMTILTRAAFVQLPGAFLLTAMAVTVVSLCLTLTDQMSAQVAASAGSDAHSFFSDVTKALTTLTAPTGNAAAAPLFAVFLGGLIAAIGAFFVWVELLIRSAAIYVAVLFLPFTFVAMIWPTTARWCKRLLELLFAIVFSKFVIVAILALAAAGLGQSRSDEAFQGVLAGAALLVLAACSPFALLRLIPMVESAAHTSSRSGAGSQSLGPSMGPAAVMRRVADGNWGGGGAGGLRLAPAAVGGSVPIAAAAVAGSGVRAGTSAAASSAGSGTQSGGSSGSAGDAGTARPTQATGSANPTTADATPSQGSPPASGPRSGTPHPASSPDSSRSAVSARPERPRDPSPPTPPAREGGDDARR
jgi:hypothetical protein